MTENAIQIENLTKAYPKFKLQNLNLTLPTGCILGLIGENGAGKSTTIRLLLKLLERDSGKVELLGTDIDAPEFISRCNDIGVVLDEVGFPAQLNARQLDRIFSDTYARWDSERFFSLLRQFGVPDDKPFQSYSRGMKMKAGIASALAHDAKLLILDEATSGLDPVAREEVLEILTDFTRDETHSILISSHIVSDLEKLCDYIAFLHKGKLLLFEEKDRLLESYGVLQCTEQTLDALPKEAVVGKKVGKYGAEVLLRREFAPRGAQLLPCNIEDLFVYMVKEETL